MSYNFSPWTIFTISRKRRRSHSQSTGGRPEAQSADIMEQQPACHSGPETKKINCGSFPIGFLWSTVDKLSRFIRRTEEDEHLDNLQQSPSETDSLEIPVADIHDEEHRQRTSGVPMIDLTNDEDSETDIQITTTRALEMEVDRDNRSKFEDLLKNNFFFEDSYSILNQEKSLNHYDYGSMGCALKSNMLMLWKKHFIIAENMLEVEFTSTTHEPLLKPVDRPADWMLKDMNTGECFRADRLIKNAVEKIIAEEQSNESSKAALQEVLRGIPEMDEKKIQEVINQFGLKSPNGNELSPPKAFNLMFPSQIGLCGDFKAYLCAETGIVVKSKLLLEFDKAKISYSAAMINLGLHSELSRGQRLIRVRDLTMCTIKHFLNPRDKNCTRLIKVFSYPMLLLPADYQMDGRSAVSMTIGQAVEKGVVDNETLAYYMARSHLYMVLLGVNPSRLRFRQHLPSEKAHDVRDKWDAEILISYGWTDCVEILDRSCYDLKKHAEVVGDKKPPAPRKVNVLEVVPNMALIEKEFKNDARRIQMALAQMPDQNIEDLKKQIRKGQFILKVDDDEFPLTANMLTVKRGTKTIHIDETFPTVIETSFGIGRLMYAVLEHSCRHGGNHTSIFLSLRPCVVPVKCTLFSSANETVHQVIEEVRLQLRKSEISHRVDDTAGSLEQRYALSDQSGVPFGITVGPQTQKEPWRVRIRYSESLEQIIVKVNEIANLLLALSTERMSWFTAVKKYPKYEAE